MPKTIQQVVLAEGILNFVKRTQQLNDSKTSRPKKRTRENLENTWENLENTWENPKIRLFELNRTWLCSSPLACLSGKLWHVR
jgi:hypothetical protein